MQFFVFGKTSRIDGLSFNWIKQSALFLGSSISYIVYTIKSIAIVGGRHIVDKVRVWLRRFFAAALCNWSSVIILTKYGP
jgi:hypothetical protein